MAALPQILGLLSSGTQNQILATGALPTKIEILGAATNQATELGVALLGSDVFAVFDALKTITNNNGSTGASLALVQVVIAAIRAVVRSIETGGELTQQNFTAARVKLISTPRALVNMASLPPVGRLKNGATIPDQAPGTFLFVRGKGKAVNDRWIPYVDPLPSVIPELFWPKAVKRSDAWSLPKECTEWDLILLDTGKQDCQAHVTDAEKPSVNWPWAWPMTSPMRVAGFPGGMGDVAAEQTAANLYLLPTPQHVQTRLEDVLESETIIRRAMQVFYATAVEAAPGTWVQRITEISGTPPTKPKPDFQSLAIALKRIHDFKRVRLALQQGRDYWPLELTFNAGPDFA